MDKERKLLEKMAMKINNKFKAEFTACVVFMEESVITSTPGFNPAINCADCINSFVGILLSIAQSAINIAAERSEHGPAQIKLHFPEGGVIVVEPLNRE